MQNPLKRLLSVAAACLVLAFVSVMFCAEAVPNVLVGTPLLALSVLVATLFGNRVYLFTRRLNLDTTPPASVRLAVWLLAYWAVAAAAVLGCNHFVPGVFHLFKGYGTALALTFLPMLPLLQIDLSQFSPRPRY